jgi:glycosyltransferase involved in cell wall biosynthesis
MSVRRASIVICTYNRAELLRETLEALQAMDPVDDFETEIIVVDNNSSDETPAVVAEAAREARIPVVYLHERRQGKSFALNHALVHARGDVVALTDDDVLPAADWLARIVANFRSHDITFVFGKVLPRWGMKPPPELLSPRARDIWGPLAIVDYGETPEPYRCENLWQRLPIGANLAFARTALVAIGGWRTDLGKVNNTLISGEDHEIFMRLRRFDLYSGRYDPRITVRHVVPANRLTREYFRRWYFWHGKTQALMLDDLFPGVNINCTPHIAGVPRFLYRQGLAQFVRWLKHVGRQDALGLLIEELGLLRYAGLYLECWRRWLRQKIRRPQPAPSPLARLSIDR